MSVILTQLSDFQNDFNLQLEDTLEKLVSRAGAESQELGVLTTLMKRYSLSGGKRIRPFLFVEGFKGFGLYSDKVLKASCFVELIHHELIALDDYMDKSKSRHDEATIQYAIRDALGVGDAHFGDSVAVLAGVMYGHYAIEQLAELDFDSRRLLQLLSYYNRVVVETAYGQFHDMLLPLSDVVTEEDVYLVQLYKTAKYTIEAPLLGGALLAGASQKELELLSAYAIPLGIGFQIVDDLLGIFGENIGKSTYSDIEEGKRTLLTEYALQQGSDSQKKELRKLLTKGEISADDHARFVAIVTETGSKDYSEERAQNYLKEALKALDETNVAAGVKERLKLLSEYIITRNL